MRNTVVGFVCLAAVVLPISASAGVPAPTPCTAGRLELVAGSSVDIGFSGLLHSTELATGGAIGFDIVSRCSDDSSMCSSNGDCESNSCVATCDCDTDSSCDIAGPLDEKRCLLTLETCSIDEDCPEATPCVPFFAPPQPVIGAGFPFCISANFDGPIEGQIDASTGDVSLSGRLNWRVFLGIDVDFPCPRCGAPEDDPQIGDGETCEGGQRDGLPCTVDGVTEGFGGVSYDCAPINASNVSGAGVTVPLFEMTTEAAAKTAALPCKFFGFTGNPLVPGSNPKCTDQRGAEDPVCTSNADCLRCSGDSTTACTNNGDCTGKGECAEAPDQPVTCGFWCHCGFCDGDASLPCMEDADCPAGDECVQGTASANQPGSPQTLPNACEGSSFLCGTAEPETCENTTVGACSLAPSSPCTSNNDCNEQAEGTCTFSPLPCFEARIEREGSASPIGSFCASESKACVSNDDCTQPDDFCTDDVALPSLAGLSCMSASAAAVLNGVAGVTGPVAFEWQTRLTICGCEAPEPGCEEVCEANEPGCGDSIVQEPEDCDGGPCCDDDCVFEDAGLTCRAAVGICDVAETCSGSAANCPANETADDGSACDDETDCTTNDVCTDGQCFGTTSCGNGTIEGSCGEECDDGNTANGDGCSETCGPQTLCGDATEDGEILTSDAQRALQRAVGINVECDLTVCDVDSSGAVTTTDALRILRKAVDLPIELRCDYTP